MNPEATYPCTGREVDIPINHGRVKITVFKRLCEFSAQPGDLILVVENLASNRNITKTCTWKKPNTSFTKVCSAR